MHITATVCKMKEATKSNLHLNQSHLKSFLIKNKKTVQGFARRTIDSEKKLQGK